MTRTHTLQHWKLKVLKFDVHSLIGFLSDVSNWLLLTYCRRDIICVATGGCCVDTSGCLARFLGQSAIFTRFSTTPLWQNQANWIHGISTASQSVTDCKNHFVLAATLIVTYIGLACESLKSARVRVTAISSLINCLQSCMCPPICSVLWSLPVRVPVQVPVFPLVELILLKYFSFHFSIGSFHMRMNYRD